MKSLFSSEFSPLGTGDRFSSLAASLHVNLFLSLGCTGVFLPAYFAEIVPHMEVFLLCLIQQVSSTSSNSMQFPPLGGNISSIFLSLYCSHKKSFILSWFLGTQYLFSPCVFRFLITSFEQLDYNVFCIVFFHSFFWCL